MPGQSLQGQHIDPDNFSFFLTDSGCWELQGAPLQTAPSEGQRAASSKVKIRLFPVGILTEDEFDSEGLFW